MIWFMVFNITFNNISVISWWLVLLVEETRVPGKNTDLLQVTDKLYPIMLYRVRLAWAGFELTTLVVMGTDCIGSCKSIYHTITTTMAPSMRCYRTIIGILSITSLLTFTWYKLYIHIVEWIVPSRSINWLFVLVLPVVQLLSINGEDTIVKWLK